MPNFFVTYTLEVEIKIDDAVFSILDDPTWKENFYPDFTREDLAAFLGLACGVDELKLSEVEGFYGFSDNLVVVENAELFLEDISEKDDNGSIVDD